VKQNPTSTGGVHAIPLTNERKSITPLQLKLNSIRDDRIQMKI
jgi:hypothetical protein